MVAAVAPKRWFGSNPGRLTSAIPPAVLAQCRSAASAERSGTQHDAVYFRIVRTFRWTFG